MSFKKKKKKKDEYFIRNISARCKLVEKKKKANVNTE